MSFSVDFAVSVLRLFRTEARAATSRVELHGRTTIVPTGSREIRTGTFHKILRDLGLRPEDLR